MKQGRDFAHAGWLVLLGMVCSLLAVSAAQAQQNTAQARTARAFEAARQEGQPALRMFLLQMPKGACAQLVGHSQKAQEEWEIERRFYLFEASF